MTTTRTHTFLVVSTAITAHTLNAGRLVRGLTDRGHTVLWYAAERFAGYVEGCGAVHLISSPTAGYEEALPGAGGELSKVKRLYRDEVVGRAAQQRADVLGLLAGRSVDAVLCDTLIPAASLVAAELRVPWATFGDGPLLWWDEDTPPFGTGLPPMAGRAGRHRNRNVQAVIDRWLFGPYLPALNQLRSQSGLPAAHSMREATMSPALHLQGCPPGFEYPRDGRPGHVHFVGALGPAVPVAPPLPDELARDRRARPLALVTQGTLRPDLTELVLPGCAALIAEGFDVVVAGTPDGPWNRWPGRVHPLESVDYADALAEADLFVTNGGYTGVTLALAAGVPVIQAGNSEEKPDIGARVAWSGVGATLRIRRPSPWMLRPTIRWVMGSPRRQQASARLAAESARYDAATIGPELLIGLARG